MMFLPRSLNNVSKSRLLFVGYLLREVSMVSEYYRSFAAGGEDRTRDGKNPNALPTALNQHHCAVIMLRHLNTIVIVEYLHGIYIHLVK